MTLLDTVTKKYIEISPLKIPGIWHHLKIILKHLGLSVLYQMELALGQDAKVPVERFYKKLCERYFPHIARPTNLSYKHARSIEN